MPLSTQEAKIITVIGETIYGMALGDIHRSLGCDYPTEKITRDSDLKDGQCLVGSVMLAVSLIEAIGHHCLGNAADNKSETAFTKFSEDYLRKVEDKYVTKDLWQVLRNGLLHNYATRHNYGVNPVKYALVKNAKDAHLSEVPDKPGYVYFNIQSFIDDIDQAANLFLDELEKEGTNEQKQTLLWITDNLALSAFPTTFSNGGLITVAMASSMMSGSEAAELVTYTEITTGRLLEATNRTFTQMPSWKHADRNRSRGGHFLK